MGHQLCGKAIVFFGLALGGDSGDAVEEDCWCRICDNACADNVQLPKLEDAGGRFRSCWRSPRVGLDGSAMGWLACFWMPEADVLCTYFRHNAARIQEFH